LADRGIPVEIKRLSNFSLYFGAPAPEEFEVRVPPEHLKEALEVLEALRQEMELNVLAEAGVAPGDESDELPPPERRPRQLASAGSVRLPRRATKIPTSSAPASSRWPSFPAGRFPRRPNPSA